MKSKLLPYTKFLKIDYPVPYIYKYKNKKQFIYCFGSMHTFLSNDKQIKKLGELWELFLKQKSDKKFVFVESLSDFKGNKNEVIRQGGEMGYANFLCRKNKIEYGSPEPTVSEWYEALAKHFDREVVAYYDFARICFQWHSTDKSIKFSEYMKPFFRDSKRDTGWKDVDFSLKGMAKIHEKLFGTKMDYNDYNFYYSNLNPTIPKKEQTIINKISFFDEQGVRDKEIIKKIIEKLKDGYSLFVVYGQTHVAVIEPIIKEFMSKKVILPRNLK